MKWNKYVSKDRLVNFPVLQLLMASIKSNIGHLIIKSKPSEGEEGPVQKLVSIGGSPSDYTLEILSERRQNLSNITSALCRCGLIKPYDLDKVASQLAQHEDLIMGLDTNLIYNCIISEHLLGAMEDHSPYSYTKTPNWLLIAVPGVVMKEIENAANHKKKGRLTHIGRMGFRALQEIMVLEENKGSSGSTVLVVGKTNPQQLRYSKEEEGKFENADSLIRDQFRSFIRELDFRKGIYFLTMDKTNASLGKAEGLNSVRVKHPKMVKNGYEFHQLEGDTILLARIIYELAVEFGNIELSWKEHGRYHFLELDSGWQWKNMGHWENWQLLCTGYDHNFFQEVNGYGKIPISRTKRAWEENREAMR